MTNAVSTTKPFQTTKLTKGTKGSDNHDFKLRVLRAFVVKSVFTFWLRLRPAVAFVVETLFSILPTGNPEKRIF
jgi:hypothetical protein